MRFDEDARLLDLDFARGFGGSSYTLDMDEDGDSVGCCPPSSESSIVSTLLWALAAAFEARVGLRVGLVFADFLAGLACFDVVGLSSCDSTSLSSAASTTSSASSPSPSSPSSSSACCQQAHK